MSKEGNVLAYYALCNELKDVIRTGWIEWNVQRDRKESIAEHIFKVQMLAIAMKSEYQYDIDMMKVIYMLAIHEIGETVIGDLTQFQIGKEEKEKIEHEAVHKILGKLLDGEQIEKLFLEFDAHQTKEAMFAYQCDKLECDLQCKLYDQEGCVDLNNQENNKTFYNEKVQKYIKEGASWSEMWLRFGRDVYPYDENFMKVSKYAEKTWIRNPLKKLASMETVEEFKNRFGGCSEKNKEVLDIVLPEMKALGTYVGINTRSFNNFYMGGGAYNISGNLYKLYCMNYEDDKLDIILYTTNGALMYDYNVCYASTYQIDLAARKYVNNRYRLDRICGVIRHAKTEGILPESEGMDFTDLSTYTTHAGVMALENAISYSQCIDYDELSYIFKPNEHFVEKCYNAIKKCNPDLLDRSLAASEEEYIKMFKVEKGINLTGAIVTNKKYQELQNKKRQELVRVLQRIKKD